MVRKTLAVWTLASALACSLGACGGPAQPQPSEPAAPEPSSVAEPAASEPAAAPRPDPAEVVAAPDRSEDDREVDARRKPAQLLAFLELEPGMKVADIGAGTGYTTELLARMVGPEGRVYGQNPAFVLERFARAGWDERRAKAVNAEIVVSLEREFDDPFPDDIEPLDRVVNVLFFHDFGWMEIDRAAHLADVFAALRPGGRYVVIDASAAEGRGLDDSKSLHRVEEALVVREFEAAGFVQGRSADFLRNPEDTLDWNALPWRDAERAARGEFSDKFVIEFIKP